MLISPCFLFPTIKIYKTIILPVVLYGCETWSLTLREECRNVAVPAAPLPVPGQRPLAPSVASVTSVANDKDDNETILAAEHRSPGTCLTAEENPRKPQLGNRLIKGLCDQLSPQMGSFSS